MIKVPLGKILVVEGFITNQQLYEAIKEQKDDPDTKIGDILIKLGHLTLDQLKTALAKQKEDKSIPSLSATKEKKEEKVNKPQKIGENLAALMRLLIKKKIITKEELMDELNQ